MEGRRKGGREGGGDHKNRSPSLHACVRLVRGAACPSLDGGGESIRFYCRGKYSGVSQSVGPRTPIFRPERK